MTKMVSVDEISLGILKDNTEILNRMVASDEYISNCYVKILNEYNVECRIENLYEDFIDNLNDVIAEAEVDEPAGRGCGYAIRFDEEFVKQLVKRLVVKVKEVENE